MENSSRDITLVLGVSSVGKSQYISEKYSIGSRRGPVLFPNDIIANNGLPNHPCIVHFNTLRPVVLGFGDKCSQFIHDPVLQKIMLEQHRLRCIHLLAEKSILLTRVRTRRYTEPKFGICTPYNSERRLEMYSSLDLEDYTSEWRKFLWEHMIPTEEVQSLKSGFRSFAGNDFPALRCAR